MCKAHAGALQGLVELFGIRFLLSTSRVTESFGF